MTVEVAIAILYQYSLDNSTQKHSPRFLMQLRDQVPNIVFPGHWGLFGGHLEPGETPEVALKRELQEEIGYSVSQCQKFGCYNTSKVIRHVFYSPLSVSIQELVLTEGWDLDLLTPEDIQLGSHYSDKAGQTKP